MSASQAGGALSKRLLSTWAREWGLPGLENKVSVAYSVRLRRSLGRCTPVDGRIVLCVSLRSASPEQLAPVLCHEAAHAATFLLYGRQVAPHGREWAELVKAVGHTPSMAILKPDPTILQAPRHHRKTYRFEHRCPVCQSVRWAARQVSRWRCAECRAAGLDGVLEILDHAAWESPS